MTAIRHTLQKDLFEPDEERLLSLMHVTALVKKRKTSFLCLTVTTHHPVVVRLHEVQKVEKSDVYKKKRFWLLKDLKVIDGINPRKIVPEFEITSDKVYKYLVTNPSEKDPFIKQLWKLCSRYIPAQKPDFVNISLPVEDLELANISATLSLTDGASHQEPEVENYQPISAKEEEDFRALLRKCNMTIGQAEKFYDHLTRELSVLDSANIQTIMGSEMHLAELMNKIDAALEEASSLEEILDSYDELLFHVREGVEMMEEKDSLIHTHTSNRKRLIDELHQFLNSLDLPTADQQILAECNFTDSQKISRCTQAAFALQRCMNTKLSPGYEKLKAYNDQMKMYSNLRDSFADRLVAHLTALIRNLTNEPNPTNGITLPRHDSLIFLPLKPFSELISWLKASVPDGYKILQERYISLCKEMYQREILAFFELVRMQIRPGFFERRSTGGSKSSGNPLDLNRSFPKSPSTSLAVEKADYCGDVKSSFIDKQQFESLIESIFDQIEPAIIAEQKFCVWFFHIIVDLKIMATDNESVNSGDSAGSASTPEKKLERQYNEQIKAMMSQTFEALDQQLNDFVAYCNQLNPYYSVHLMALLSDRALKHKDASSSFLANVLGKTVVIVKRRFDIFMEKQATALAEARLIKRTRVGILPNVHNFEVLATETESAFKTSQRRGDLDRWYPQLALAVCQSIETCATDPNSKSPPSVVRMENYHRLLAVLSKLKIASLENLKKEIKQSYQLALDAYVKEYMGKPMEKLQNFFEQIESCIEQGMKPESIAYQQNFSRPELKKAISAYSGKEVKKGLDQLYRKVEKHLCEEENLLQVVWRNMNDEFIQQYKHYQQLIDQCYAGSSVQLEFSIQDVLNYFSDIAQHH